MITDGVKKRKSGTITINYTIGGKQYGLTLTPHEIVENYLIRPTKRATDDAERAARVNGPNHWERLPEINRD